MVRPPVSFYLVAALFIADGCNDLYAAIPRWAAGQFHLPLNVIAIFVGVGLLRRKRGWFLCAVALLWLCLAILLAYFTWFMLSDWHVKVSRPSPSSVLRADLLFIGYIVASMVATVWSMHVLNRKDVAGLFAAKEVG